MPYKKGTYKCKDETKKLISERLKAKWADPEYKNRMIKSLYETAEARGQKVRDSYTAERRQAYSDRMKQMWKNKGGTNDDVYWIEEDHPAWKGDDAKYEAVHIRMRAKHLKDRCETCGITQDFLKENNRRGLCLHCVSGDIYDTADKNWKTFCTGCHTTHHHLKRKETKELCEQF